MRREIATTQPVCTWTRDDIDDSWEGTCGVKWVCLEGTPCENQMRFCPRCGKPLQEKGRAA